MFAMVNSSAHYCGLRCLLLLLVVAGHSCGPLQRS